jgi:5-(aminomethyl)-3-furanmethanol phosphate kinase
VTRSSVTIVKIGGSLLDWIELPARLADFLDEPRSRLAGGHAILIAGGGRAADLVRQLDRTHRLGDETAHRLALRAMDLSALFLSALLPGSIAVDRLDALPAARRAGRIPVLLGGLILEEIERPGVAPLPRCWDTTSDSIAARIAVHLRAESLILLKSASLPPGASRQEAARLERVDPHFPGVAQAIPRVEYLNLRAPSSGLLTLPSEIPKLDVPTPLGQNPG